MYRRLSVAFWSWPSVMLHTIRFDSSPIDVIVSGFPNGVQIGGTIGSVVVVVGCVDETF
jgi:hypothetical protein